MVEILERELQDLKWQDIEEIMNLSLRQNSLFKEKFGEEVENYYSGGKNPRSKLYIARQNTSLVGWCYLYFAHDNCPCLMIYVRKKFRRKKIGTCLVQMALAPLMQKPTVVPHDEASRSFFNKFGLME